MMYQIPRGIVRMSDKNPGVGASAAVRVFTPLPDKAVDETAPGVEFLSGVVEGSLWLSETRRLIVP